MKILLGHVVHSPGIDEWYRDIANAACDGIEVKCFCVTLRPPGPRLSWQELDSKWRRKDKNLLEMYGRLLQEAADCDVFILYNGANIHPEFLGYLSTFNVFCCFDDPESSQNINSSMAASFDAVFYGNISSRFQYKSWGCKKLAWLPIFTAPSDVPSHDEGDRLFGRERPMEISLVCDRNHYRKRRLDELALNFEQARCYGSGWETGKITDKELKHIYENTKIGWNIHNSTGPINRRLFTLAGFGCFQICDNKTGLGQIFDLGKEIIGFNTIPEAVDLTRYYLEHDDERQLIAYNGWKRFWRDYHAGAIWERIHRQLCEWGVEKHITGNKQIIALPGYSLRDALTPGFNSMRCRFGKLVKLIGDAVATDESSRNSNLPPYDERAYLGESIPVYLENLEMKGINMAKERLSRGEPFEWPNILALNWAVTSLIGSSKKIIEIGSGTGAFASFSAVDTERTIHCFEEDDFAREWAVQNRNYQNVTYNKYYEKANSQDYDLLVSIEVIEHVSDLRQFLIFCSGLAPRAIFTTPNRLVLHGEDNVGPPVYPPHVREFDPGEIYWILRQYYRHVRLYFMPDVFVPWLETMTIATHGTPIIAECIEPYTPHRL